jgi:hypothetical protein
VPTWYSIPLACVSGVTGDISEYMRSARRYCANERQSHFQSVWPAALRSKLNSGQESSAGKRKQNMYLVVAWLAPGAHDDSTEGLRPYFVVA